MTTTLSPVLRAWHGDAKLKRATVAAMAAHRKADELVQGYGYWADGKGCAVGCLIKGDDHSLYEPRFGIPEALARLEDTIFEKLSKADAQRWPERFLKAAKPGADLSLVQWQFSAFVVEEALSRPEAESVREACQPALEVVRARARGEAVTESAARSAESAARSAANAAWSAENAAWSASAWSAANAESAAPVGSAARSAANVAWSAENVERSAVWKRYAGKLIELMAAAPVRASA